MANFEVAIDFIIVRKISHSPLSNHSKGEVSFSLVPIGLRGLLGEEGAPVQPATSLRLKLRNRTGASDPQPLPLFIIRRPAAPAAPDLSCSYRTTRTPAGPFPRPFGLVSGAGGGFPPVRGCAQAAGPGEGPRVAPARRGAGRRRGA